METKKNWRVNSKHSEEESEEKEKSEKKEKNPSSQDSSKKGKSFLIVLNLFYTYSRGKSSADKRSKNYIPTKKVSDDELEVINWKNLQEEVIDDKLEVFKRKILE